MSRIQTTFTRLSKENKKALIPFIMAGFPKGELTVDLMHAAVKGGADIIELGVPFSDPMADGPVIQKAAEKALENKTNLKRIFEWVNVFRQKDDQTPIVLMGYANPIEKMGKASFVKEASQAGVDGVLIVDYPPEECDDFSALLKNANMDLIFLLAPTSTTERMQKIGQIASGYVYYVSLKGVTGSARLDVKAVSDAIPNIKQYVSIPVGVGFGIRDGKTAREIGQAADGVIIGSRLVQIIESAKENQQTIDLERFLKEIRVSIDA